MARLMLFYNEATEQEYVVLTEDDERETPIEEWERPGFKLFAEVEIDEDLAKFPTERELWKQS